MLENHIPKQIEEQAALAEQVHSQLFSQDNASVQEEPVVEQEPVQSQEPLVSAEELEELRSFKQRYQTLQGKYDAEVPRLHNELKEFKEQVFNRLEQQAKPEPSEPESDPFADIREQYGDEFIDVVTKILEARVEPKLKQVVQPVSEKIDSIENTQIETARGNFEAYLDQHVKGNWRNAWSGADEKFMQFVNSPDPSGLYTYGQLLEAYNNEWDGEKLAKVLNLYFGVEPQKSQQEQSPSPQQSAMIAPSRQTNVPTPQANDSRIWTRADIAEFQKLDRMGKLTPEESKALWDDLLIAPSQNRIRG